MPKSTDLISILKQAAELKNQAWREFRFHPLWKAIEKEIEKAPATTLVELPECTVRLVPAMNGNGGTYGSGVSLDEISRAADGAFIRFSATFVDEDDCEHDKSFSIGVPDDLLANFTPAKFNRFVRAHHELNKQRAEERAYKILERVGLKLTVKRRR